MLVNSKKAVQNMLADIEDNQPSASIPKTWLYDNNQYTGSTPNNVLEALRLFLLEVYEDNQKKLDTTIAKLAGFSPLPEQYGPVTANLNIEKLTYYIVFRYSFYWGCESLFENWLESANQLRSINYLNHQNNTTPFYPTPGSNPPHYPKRLHHNGEEEASVITTTEPQAKIYNQESDYHFFGIVVDYLLKEQGYFLGDIPPVEYFFLGENETQYFSDWIRKERSKPFIPGQERNPVISSNFYTIIINVENINTDLYYNKRSARIDEKLLPKIISIIDNETNTVVLNFFKETNINLFSPQVPSDPSLLGFDGHSILRDSMNKFYLIDNQIKAYLYTDAQFTIDLHVDYLSGEDLKDDRITKGIVTKYKLDVKQATVQIPSGLSIDLDSLIGLPFEKVGSQFVLKLPKSNVEVTGSTASGITIAHGIDFGGGLAYQSSETEVKDANVTWLDNFLTNTIPEWSSMTNDERNIVFEAINKKGNAARVYWVQHKQLFGRLNLEDNRTALDNPPSSRNWKTALCHLINFYEDRYYGAFKGQLTMDETTNPYNLYTPSSINTDTSGLLRIRTARAWLPLIKTSPNIIEKYVILTLGINTFNTIRNNENDFTKAVNQHSLKLLTDLIKRIPSSNNNISKIRSTLIDTSTGNIKDEIIHYYNIHHYCNEFDNP